MVAQYPHGHLAKKPAWFILMLLIAVSSLAAAFAVASSNPAQIGATVVTRLAFGTPVVGRGTTVSTVGSVYFTAQLVAYVDEPVNFTVPAHNTTGT